MENLLPLPDEDQAREWKELDGFQSEDVLERNLKEYLSSELEAASSEEPIS